MFVSNIPFKKSFWLDVVQLIAVLDDFILNTKEMKDPESTQMT